MSGKGLPHTLECTAIVPARGGSKGIPHKNLQDVCGVPLLAYSILVARAARRVTRVVVSTDDEEIAREARCYGAEVPFLRPAKISGDRAGIGDAVKHMLDGLNEGEGYHPDVVAILYPTHPFRSPKLVDCLLGRITEGYQSVVTVRPIPLTQRIWCTLAENGTVRRLTAGQGGVVDIAMRSYGLFEAYSTRPAPLDTYLHQLVAPEELIDIDDPEDLALARSVVRAGFYHLVSS